LATRSVAPSGSIRTIARAVEHGVIREPDRVAVALHATVGAEPLHAAVARITREHPTRAVERKPEQGSSADRRDKLGGAFVQTEAVDLPRFAAGVEEPLRGRPADALRVIQAVDDRTEVSSDHGAARHELAYHWPWNGGLRR
jgi:hypothetical protein